jgi:hypothetical protein
LLQIADYAFTDKNCVIILLAIILLGVVDDLEVACLRELEIEEHAEDIPHSRDAEVHDGSGEWVR